MPNFSKLSAKITRRKFIAGTALLLIAAGGYFVYAKFFGNDDTTRYAAAKVQKGTLIVSVSGSGQVSASNQVELKSKVSGTAVYVGVKNGEFVRAGALVVQVEAADAQKSVRDAEVNLESAKLQLEKLKGPEGLAMPKNKREAQEDLKKAYDDGFNTVANAFLDLPAVISGVRDMLYGENIIRGQWNGDYFADVVKTYDERIIQFKDDAYSKYQEARGRYDQNFSSYKSASRFSNEDTIEALIAESYETARAVAEAVKSATNLTQFYEDKLSEKNTKPAPQADTFLSALGGYTSQTNSHLMNLLSVKNDIKNAEDAIANADLDIESQELAVKQRENALADAKEKLADYFIRAPFDGIVAKLNVQRGDSISSAAALGTLITAQKIASISLNEVDAAKAATGQKSTLTFDAVPDLTITGRVAEIDALGTISQGVVTYSIKIALDAADERVKPGMSVSAAIITDVKQNVLLAPNSAVKQQDDAAYVEIFAGENQAPKRQSVQIGLSNDTMTEIISGLEEDDSVVTQTITAGASPNQNQQTTSVRIPGITGGGGFRMR